MGLTGTMLGCGCGIGGGGIGARSANGVTGPVGVDGVVGVI
jgi:hypothetical protein